MKSYGIKGFNLVELVIAIGILSVGIFTLLTMFSTSLQARAKSSNLTAATHLAATEIQRARQSALHDRPSGSKALFWGSEYPSPATPFRSNEYTVSGTKFTAEVFAVTVRTPASGRNRLKKVDVVVSWSGGQKSGQGRTKARASSLVAEP